MEYICFTARSERTNSWTKPELGDGRTVWKSICLVSVTINPLKMGAFYKCFYNLGRNLYSVTTPKASTNIRTYRGLDWYLVSFSYYILLLVLSLYLWEKIAFFVLHLKLTHIVLKLWLWEILLFLNLYRLLLLLFHVMVSCILPFFFKNLVD